MKNISIIDNRKEEHPDHRWYSVTCLCYDHNNQPIVSLPLALVFHPNDLEWFIKGWCNNSLPNMFDVKRYEIVIDETQMSTGVLPN